MCPKTLFNLFLLFLVLVFGFLLLKRQRNRALDNFAVLSGLLETPQVIPNFFGLSLSLSGFYRGRKFGWDYNVFDERNELRIYIEPGCDIQLKTFMFSYPKPNASTYVRGKRIYFSVRSPRNSLLEILGAFDPVPHLSRQDAQLILEELTKAAEIVEANPAAIKKY